MLAEIKYQESQGRMESAQAIIGFPGTSAKISFMYLIGTPAGTEHYVERHELGLFTSDEMTTL